MTKQGQLPKRRLSTYSSTFGLVVSCAVLIGWKFDITILKSLSSTWVSMKPNTAILFILVSLALRVTAKNKNKKYVQALSATAMVLSLAILSQYITGNNLNIDELLFRDVPDGVGTTHGGRPSIITLVDFILLSLALIVLAINHVRRRVLWSQALTFLALLITYANLMIYIYSSPFFPSVSSSTWIAAHTLITLFVLGFGILALNPKEEVVALFFAGSLSAHLARRLAAAAFILPSFFGWLGLELQRRGEFKLSELGFGAFAITVALSISLLLVIWRAVDFLQKSEHSHDEALRLLKENETRMHLAQGVAKFGTFDWNIKTGLNTWSPELESLYGLPAGGFARTQRAWEDLVHPEDRTKAIGFVDSAFTSKDMISGEWRVVWPDGKIHWIAGRFQVLRDPNGKPEHLIGVNYDITERKKTEDALLSAMRARDEMVGVISHELKNPLTALQTGAVLIKRLLPEDDKFEPIRRQADRFEPSIQRMNRLITDLLDVTRLEANKLKTNLVACDLNEAVEEVVASFQSLAQEKAIQVHVEIARSLPKVLADQDRLIQIVGNLLHNAIKFSYRNSEIKISAKQVKHLIELRVTDFGKGISKENLPHIFDRYWQAKETAFMGTGLGLAIVKGLVEAQKGQVWVESEIGVGTSFIVRLQTWPSAVILNHL